MTPTDLEPGDVLLFLPSGWLGHLVAWTTGSEYCHSAMYVGDGVAEIREFIGGRLLPVADHAGETIDVFRADADVSVKNDAVLSMMRLLLERYSFWHGVAAWLRRRLPRWLRRMVRSESDHGGYHCSQAVSKAYRDAACDLCPRTPDWATTPGDLARAPRLRLVGRLEP